MKTVLIIDSSPLFRDYMRTKLQEHKLRVITAPNGLDGIAKLRSEVPDLTILDYHLPLKSGKEVLTEMRKNPNTKKSPVILVSSKIDTTKVVEIAKFNVKKFFTKPIKYDSLLTTIGAILGIDVIIDSTPCKIDAHFNDDIIFVEIAEGLNIEKIELLKYKLTELLKLYEMSIPKVLVLLAGLEMTSVDVKKLTTLFETILNSANTSPRLIKVLTNSNVVRDVLKSARELQDIVTFDNLPGAMDALLGIKPDLIAHDEVVVNRLLQISDESNTDTFDMRFESEKDGTIRSESLEGVSNVAIIDDDFVVRELVKSVFEDSSWNVSTYADGEDFLKILGKKEIDIIFLDLMMPKINGLQVLNHMKKNKISIPTVIFSAVNQKEMVSKAVELGVKSYIIKPIKPIKLVQKAKEILNLNF